MNDEVWNRARRDALIEAADEVHTEARWVMEQIARNVSSEGGGSVARWLLVERILRDRAAALSVAPQPRPGDPCGGSSKGGDGCSCDPPFAR